MGDKNCRGKGPRSYNRPWVPYGEFDHGRGEGVGAKKSSRPNSCGLEDV